ncbi:MAG: amino acid adenylation domain-containing protein [Clostridiales bacterium]|nr:amino acid adenylation domain-containing protein [Clostridiales bacterium]
MKYDTGMSSCYPLSNSQLNIWNLEQSFQGTSINNICETIRIKGVLDIVLLQTCLNQILKADPSLRTQITLDEARQPVQYEKEYEEILFPVFDFSATNITGFEHWENSVTRQVMPVLDAPLYYFAIIKLSEHEGGVFIKTHHIISDGWSQVSLINRIAQTYLALLNREPVTLPLSPSYRLHVEKEQEYLSSKACERDRKFWQETLHNAGQAVSLKDHINAELSPVGQRKTFYLSEKLNHTLNAFCTSHRVAPFAVFYMAMAIYLKRVRHADKICIGAPIHNRMDITDRQTTGMFVSTLPFFTQLDENWSFEELNRHLSDDWLDLLRHQRLPFSEIISAAKQTNPDFERPFHLVLSFHNSQAYRNRDTLVTFSGQWHYAGYQAEHICIHLNNIEDERRYSVNYDYLSQLYSKYEIEDFHYYILNILTQALAFPDRPIRELSVLGAEEEEKVLYSFNRTDAFYYEGNLCQKLEEICQQHPERVAVICSGRRYTYRELWDRANAAAQEIFRIIPSGKQIVAVLLPKSYDLFCAMAAIIRSGCAWVIVSPQLPEQRVRQIVSDSDAAVVLSTQSLAERFLGADTDIPVIDIEKLSGDGQVLFPCPATAHDLAYLVYTSGSTGTPKGVEIEQHSLLNFAEAMAPLYGKGAVLSLCNISFDAFLLESIVSLLNGQTIVLPTEYEQEDPAKLADLIRSYAVGFMATTPSRLTAYLKNKDFSSAISRLETIICGGEAFPASLLKTLSSCKNIRIYNQYGPSETTIGVSTDLLNGAPLICVGAPMQNCRFYVLDKQLRPLPIGIDGDLYIGGVCVGRGYHNAPELTEKSFLDNPYESGERIYRTGDIASWTENGEVVIKGRKDGQIKLRGQRIEPEEIASCLMLHPAVRQAVVRLLDINGQDMLVAYYVAEHPLSESELLEFAATYLPGYMIPSLFQPVQDIPLTSNGKVNDSLLPIPEVKRCDALDGYSGESADKVLSVFRKILNRPDMTVSDDYFLSGGDSLNALETLSELESVFGVRLRVADLYACRTANRLGTRLSGEHKPSGTRNLEIQKAPAQEYYPLTPAQLGIYFETQKSPRSTAYNMPCGFRVEGAVDIVRLQNAVQKLIDTEPVLRTAFVMRENGIRQQIFSHVSAEWELFEDISLEKAKETFVRPFDLSCPPLLRVALWKDQTNHPVIMLDMHHIIGDAVTASEILHRLCALYEGREAVCPAITFADYAYWLEKHQDELIRDEQEYWVKQLENMPDLPEIPTDFPRPKQFDYIGVSTECALTERDTLLCDAYCEKKAITPYMFFTGAFGLFLSKLSGSKDLMVGTPVSSRRSLNLSETAGLFVNTLPLRLMPQDSLSVSEYLEQVKENIVNLIDHPHMPLDRLVSLSDRKRGEGQNPLYNTMISMRPIDMDGFSFAGQTVIPEAVPAGSAKTDLNLEIYRSQGCYHFRIEYASSLFDSETVSLYGRSLTAIVRNMLQNDTCLLADCNAISDYDRYHLIELPHTMRMPFSHLPIDSRVDAMAKIHPEQPALIFHDQVLTLGELKKRSDSLAADLMNKGVQHGDSVGLLCRRGPQLLIGMLGILKTGAAYVPMLPNFPVSRLRYMAEISKITLTLCGSETMQSLPDGLSCRFMDIGAVTEKAAFFPPRNRTGDDVCCILFTSGSTGNPKGVMIRHRSICNLMAVLYSALSEADGGYLCTANSIFDIFTTETLIAMAFGRYSVMADEEEMVLPWKTADLIRKHRVRLIEFTPSRAQLFLDNQAFCEAISEMPVAMMCGEVLPPQLLQKLRDVGCRRIYNLYGPTETTVYSTMDDVTHAARITVGKMYPNCRGYILDESMRPVMPTASGELYFAGECLAAGYVGQEELTKSAFLPDPFYPGETMYRSGDIVRQLPDGRIDFIGRRDHQVKLNGQRIELGEITQKILDSGYAAQAATIVKKDGQFMQLCSFAEPHKNQHVDLSALRQYLKKELPHYMIPSEIYEISKMPCTASGKLDWVALQSYDFSSAASNASEDQKKIADMGEDSPTGEDIMQTVRHLWSEALSNESVAPDVSFFEQGGTSLSALSLLSSYYNLGISMTLSEFYEHPTLDGQLERIKEKFSSVSDITASEKKPEQVIEVTSLPCPAPDPDQKDEKPDIAQRIQDLWKETLSNESVLPDVSFFEQGGTSLSALSLLSSYYNLGISMTLSEFYEHPTLDGQLAFLQAAESASHDQKHPAVIQEDTLAPTSSDHKNAVFLTGATGFLGAHLLKSLLDAGYSKVFCLVRGERSRLEDTLGWYFGRQWVTESRSKIEAIAGDMTKEQFGLSDESFDRICRNITYVVHAAADVRHYACDDTPERTNCAGTAQAIALAEKSGAKLIHISTVSLCGEYLPDAPETTRDFSEHDFEIGQNWCDSIYLRGKYGAEKLVYQAIERGVTAVILRIGRLVGRSSDGMFQKNAQSNAFWGLVNGMVCLDMISKDLAELPLEMTAVDDCAKAAVLLMRSEGPVYHLFNPNILTVEDILKAIGKPLPVADREVFERHLKEKCRAGLGIRLAPLLSQYQRLMQVPFRITPVCHDTEQELQKYHFSWRKADPSVLLRDFLRND